jgi:hypothetical protein
MFHLCFAILVLAVIPNVVTCPDECNESGRIRAALFPPAHPELVEGSS